LVPGRWRALDWNPSLFGFVAVQVDMSLLKRTKKQTLFVIKKNLEKNGKGIIFYPKVVIFMSAAGERDI
jgi:hypothetical protein